MRHRGRLGDALALLSPDEAARAKRLVIPLQRERFILTRGLLRRALGTATGHHPAALQFSRGPDGKPFLQGEELEFSLSHSGDSLLVAMARGCAVGCDLELLRAVPQAASIAMRWFSPEERRALAELSGEALHRAFLSCWVRKEAALKAVGTGLQSPLDFSAGFAGPPGEQSRLTVAGRDAWLVDLVPVGGRIAAVAALRPMKVRLANAALP